MMKAILTILIALVVALGGMGGYLLSKGGHDRDELKNLSGRLSDLQEQNRILAAQVESLNAEKNRLQEENAALKKQGDALGSDKETAEKKLSQERQKFDADRAAIEADKQKALEAQKTLEENLRKALEGKEVVISQLEGRLKVDVDSKIFFSSGSADLLPGGRELLDKIVAAVATAGNQEIRVEGHTDNVPISKTLSETYPSNWELSACRATSAVRYLEKSAGLPSKRLSASGYADTRPVAPNDTEENRAKNRRIEIILTPTQGN